MSARLIFSHPDCGPLPPASRRRAGPVPSLSCALAARDRPPRSTCPLSSSLARSSPSSSFLSRDLSPAEKRRPTRQNHTFYDYPLTNNPKLRAAVLFSGSVESFERQWTPFVSCRERRLRARIRVFWVSAFATKPSVANLPRE